MWKNTKKGIEECRVNFVSLHDSFPVATNLDMENQFIYSVKEPISDDQAVNKKCVEDKLDSKVDKRIVQNVMRQVLYKAD